MGFFSNLFNVTPNTVSGKIKKVFKNEASGLFLNEITTFQAFKEIFNILKINIENAPYDDYVKIAQIGKYVYVREKVMNMSEARITDTVIVKINEFFNIRISRELAYRLYYCFKLPREVTGFDFNNTNHKEILDHIANLNCIQKIDGILLSNILKRTYGKKMGFSFDSTTEFLLYVINSNRENDIYHSQDNKYNQLFSKASLMVEIHAYVGSISLLIDALEKNPIGISARFELINSLLGLGENELAKSVLLDMKDYIMSEVEIALFYRRLGYIFIEEQKYKPAYACFMLSLNFDDNKIAYNELEYIKQNSDINYSSLDLDDIIEQNNIPSITSRTVDDLIIEANKLGFNIKYDDKDNVVNENNKYFLDIYKKIVSSVEPYCLNSNIKNEVLPFLCILADLVAIENGIDRRMILNKHLPIIKSLYSGPNCEKFLDDRMQKYGEIIRSKKCRAEWNNFNYKNSNSLITALTIFGDFIYNPACIDDYHNAPVIAVGIDKKIQFINSMHNNVCAYIINFCDEVKKNK